MTFSKFEWGHVPTLRTMGSAHAYKGASLKFSPLLVFNFQGIGW